MSKSGDGDLMAFLLYRLRTFTGPDWEQEDDVTMVLLQPHQRGDGSGQMETLARFELPSRPGNERRAMEQVAEIVGPLRLPQARLDRLKTAVAEATMNAMEHGNKYHEDALVLIEVARDDRDLMVSITGRGDNQFGSDGATPDLMAKLAGRQPPRGWGLFLIQNMVDEMQVISDEVHHTVKLVIHLTEGAQGGLTK